MHFSLFAYTLWRQGIGSLCTVCWLIPLLGHVHVFPTWISLTYFAISLSFSLALPFSFPVFTSSYFCHFVLTLWNLPLSYIPDFSILSILFDFFSCFPYSPSVSLCLSLSASLSSLQTWPADPVAPLSPCLRPSRQGALHLPRHRRSV